MDRCLSNNESHHKSYRDQDNIEYCSSPWDKLQLPTSDTDDCDYWSLSPRRDPTGGQRRSSTPYSDTSSTAAMSPDSCGARHRSSRHRPPPSPLTPDDDGTNPVESLYDLNLTDTMHSGRSQGSNASSHRSSASSAVSWDSNRSSDSGSAAIPSFKSYALRYVSRPDPVTFSSDTTGGGTFRPKNGVFGSIREERAAVESADSASSGGSGRWFKRDQTSSQARRLAGMAISEEQAADVVALGELIGGRRVRIPFMQSKKSTGSGKKKTPSIVQQLLALRGSRTLPRGVIDDGASNAPPTPSHNGGRGDGDRDSLMEALQLFKGTSLEEALLPLCDYADNTDNSDWPCDDFMPPPATTNVPRRNFNASPTPSLSDVEMPSKPPSRESSFRGEDDIGAGDEMAAPTISTTGSKTMTSTWPCESVTCGNCPRIDGSMPPMSRSGFETPGTACAATTRATCVSKKDAQAMPVERDANADSAVGASAASAAVAASSADSKKRVYGCTVPDCGKVYTKSSHLKSHLRSHTGKCTCTRAAAAPGAVSCVIVIIGLYNGTLTLARVMDETDKCSFQSITYLSRPLASHKIFLEISISNE